MTDNKIIFEEEFTTECLENEFLNCKTCSKRIYQDIKNYFEENREFKSKEFKKQYNKIMSGEYTIDHLNRMVTENGNNPISIMIKKILNVYNNFTENMDQYLNCCELLNFYEDSFRELLENATGEHVTDEIDRVENIIDGLQMDINEVTPLYNPTESEWYHETCPNKLLVYKKHEMNGMIPNENYYVGFKSCCDVDLIKIVKSMIFTYLFELLTHKKVLPIFKKFMNYPNKMEETIKKKLIDLKNQKILCCEWKGSNYYYKKLFYKSIYLDDIPIASEELHMKYIVGFDDMICGHPKASHGWMYESWLESQQLMSNHMSLVS